MKLIEQLPDNSFELKRLIKVGVLQNFVAYRGALVPRYFFLALFFTMFTAAYVTMTSFVPIGAFDRFIAIAVGVVGALFGWYETYRLWKLKLT